MTEKYLYTGPQNKRCPMCNSTKDIGPAVIYLIENKKFKEHRWCKTCFNSTHRLIGAARTERDIEALIPTLTDTAFKALGPHNIPEDFTVKGFHLMTTPKQGLTLVLELRNVYN